MKYVTASALVLFGLAACSGPGAVTPRGALMYQVPSPPSVKYLTEGSQDVMVDAGAMGSITSTSSSETILAMDFVTGPDGVEVTTRFEKVSASVDQPMGGTISATEADVEGDLIFTLDGRGRGTVVSVPEVTGSAEQRRRLIYFMGMDKVRFRRPVVPGDQILFEAKMLKFRSKAAKMSGTATVDNQLVAEAELMASFGENK